MKKVSKWLIEEGYTYVFMGRRARTNFYATKAQPTKVGKNGEFEFSDDTDFDVYVLDKNDVYDFEKGKLIKLCQ